MLKAIIIDNEKPAIDILKILLEKTGQVEVVGSYMNAEGALWHIQGLKPDVVFLDIEMPEITGLQLAEKIIISNSRTEIIFVTAYDQYALDAFRVNALDYLLKPLSYEDVRQTIHRINKRKWPSQAVASRSENLGRIYCFSKLAVYGAGSEQAVKWRTSKAEELFAFMLQNLNEEVSKWRICEALWSDLDINKIDVHLHTTVYKMKMVLSSVHVKYELSFKNGCYKLTLPEAYIDTLEFNAVSAMDYIITSDTVDRYYTAFSLYRGGYLEENGYPWSLLKAGEYLKKYNNMTSVLVKYFIEKSDYNAAEKILREVFQRSPLNDEFNEMLLRLYYIKKDRTALASHYNTIKNLYLTELGIAPSNAMQAIYNNINKM